MNVGQWSLPTFNNSLLQYDSKCTFQCDSRRGCSMKRQFCSSSPHVSVSLLVSLPFFLKNFFVFPKLYQCPGSWLWQADMGTKTVNERRKNKTQFVFLPFLKSKLKYKTVLIKREWLMAWGGQEAWVLNKQSLNNEFCALILYLKSHQFQFRELIWICSLKKPILKQISINSLIPL